MGRRALQGMRSVTVGFALLCFSGAGFAQSVLATGDEADVTDDGLHRIDPLIMEAAWVVEDFDLSAYTRLLVMPTAVQFRNVRRPGDNARSRAAAEAFPLDDDRKQWLRDHWRDAVDRKFARERNHEGFDGDVSDVLVMQGFLVDVVSRIPPNSAGSVYTVIQDPWSVTVVVELRDAATARLLARTIDRRNARGLIEVGAVWYQTEQLLDRWAEVMAERLDLLSELGGRGRWAPPWVNRAEPAGVDQ